MFNKIHPSADTLSSIFDHICDFFVCLYFFYFIVGFLDLYIREEKLQYFYSLLDVDDVYCNNNIGNFHLVVSLFLIKHW